eukprot:5571266-Heterocapsa_arctica.AAC.1
MHVVWCRRKVRVQLKSQGLTQAQTAIYRYDVIAVQPQACSRPPRVKGWANDDARAAAKKKRNARATCGNELRINQAPRAAARPAARRRRPPMPQQQKLRRRLTRRQ